MFRIDTPDAIENRFQGGNPSLGLLATQVTPDWLNAVQEEIANAIEGQGQTLDKSLTNQLSAVLTAIKVAAAAYANNAEADAKTYTDLKFAEYKAQIVWGLDYTTLASFNDTSLPSGTGHQIYEMGNLRAKNGCLLFEMTPSCAMTALFSMIVKGGSAIQTDNSIAGTVLKSDDNISIFLDGTQVFTQGKSETPATFAFNMTQGEHLLQIMVSSSEGCCNGMVDMQPNASVTFCRASLT